MERADAPAAPPERVEAARPFERPLAVEPGPGTDPRPGVRPLALGRRDGLETAADERLAVERAAGEPVAQLERGGGGRAGGRPAPAFS